MQTAIIQDGLRFFQFGNLSLPLGDPSDGQEEIDPTDQGQKAFSYRAQPMGEPDWMHLASPATLIPTPLDKSKKLRIHLVTAADKPRNHTFTVHGHSWDEWPDAHTNTGMRTRVGAVTSLSSGSVETLRFEASNEAGDYAYRTGALRWALPQGLWGILRMQ